MELVTCAIGSMALGFLVGQGIASLLLALVAEARGMMGHDERPDRPIDAWVTPIQPHEEAEAAWAEGRLRQ